MRTLTTVMAAVALMATSAACHGERPANNTPPTDECGARLLDRWVNSDPTPEVRAYIAARVGNRPIRYYTQGDVITMDYNPARLNVELGRDGRIRRFRCG